MNLVKDFVKYNIINNTNIFNLLDKDTFEAFILLTKYFYIYYNAYSEKNIKINKFIDEFKTLNEDDFAHLIYMLSSDLIFLDYETLNIFSAYFNTCKLINKKSNLFKSYAKTNLVKRKIFKYSYNALDSLTDLMKDAKNKFSILDKNDLNVDLKITLKDLEVFNKYYKTYIKNLQTILNLRNIKELKVSINNNKQTFIKINKEYILEKIPSFYSVIHFKSIINISEFERKLKFKNNILTYYDNFQINISFKEFNLEDIDSEHFKYFVGLIYFSNFKIDTKIINKTENKYTYETLIHKNSKNVIKYIYSIEKKKLALNLIIHSFTVELENFYTEKVDSRFLENLNSRILMFKHHLENKIHNIEHIDEKTVNKNKFITSVIYKIYNYEDFSRTNIEFFFNKNKKLMSYKIFDTKIFKLLNLTKAKIMSILNTLKYKNKLNDTNIQIILAEIFNYESLPKNYLIYNILCDVHNNKEISISKLLSIINCEVTF